MKKRKGRRILSSATMLLLIFAVMFVGGCGKGQKETVADGQTAVAEKKEAEKEAADGGSTEEQDISGAPELPGLICEAELNLQYAEAFHIYRYSAGFQVIDVEDSFTYLLVPEGKRLRRDFRKTSWSFKSLWITSILQEQQRWRCSTPLTDWDR